MNVGSPHVLRSLAPWLSWLALGCGSEIQIHPPAREAEPLLVGAWEWQPEVSHLEVDGDLRVVQTSVFDNARASPSSYRFDVTNENTLVLDGWMANAPCRADIACDEGRVHQRQRMSYHVDADHFFPFALLRLTGEPGPAAEGVFEGWVFTETLRDADPQSEVVETLELRWRLSISADGSWSRDTTEADGGSDASSGSWTVDEPGELTLVETGGAVHNTYWKGDVIALDGLVFTRRAP